MALAGVELQTLVSDTDALTTRPPQTVFVFNCLIHAATKLLSLQVLYSIQQDKTSAGKIIDIPIDF